MTVPAGERLYADHVLNGWLTSVGLGVEYTRAAGNTLYLNENGVEVPVLDHICGFGSLIFGHHDPEIVAFAKECLDRQVPVFAQLSVQSPTSEIAAKLNSIVRRETGDERAYSAVFANTGAEAIEICLKHAELERQERISALVAEIEANIDKARAAVRAGTVDRIEVTGPADGLPHDVTEFDALIAAVERRNAEVTAGRPVFLALTHAFHGKLAASVQLTHSPQWRAPFTALASTVRFLDPERPEAIRPAVNELRQILLDIELAGGVARMVARDFPAVGAFFVEPVQGANGMRPLSEHLVREIRAACDALGCPLVVDEIHSGMGRTGAFLASSHLGLRGDYYTLGKSLGGGITKASVALFSQDRFRPAFEVIHSSTFAKDGLSTAIAAKVLDMLEADDGLAYRTAAERGRRLRAMLDKVAADFPAVVTAVNGIGLMLGMEFADQARNGSEVIAEKARAGGLGHTLAGYVLRVHRVRLLPVGPSTNSVRFEPSIRLTDDEITQTEAALRDICSILRDQDGERLVTVA
ncbi:aminotransferase class III-fold pyridoxal phosphate-dependent enzyme [Micromonospora craniellae]|uniref:Aminotransferase class III-fold pyridoxal phosphate-dependent enzyme n=2 Tax=Micromonospora craniellae TaxID=2294034 RepID=A0A372G4M6_9ACTN|nr:aminotransferase class III-fold pyridoxal phosphate-dependent enzyme [Micromonospora craniellae]RFS47953.1 aminotransferase class III-fold pyridoxal phosphate-dependent enzyme [Micromonospora craniellae]